MAKAIGIEEAVTTCDCCGKSNLKHTIAIELDDGEIVYYGSVCAVRNTGKSRVVINKEINDAEQKIRDAAVSELRSSAEWIALNNKINIRPRTLIGKAAMEFISKESAAESLARNRIALKFNLKPYQILA